MKTWELLCVDRETGAESVQRIPAPDERTALSIASDRGLMVAKVTHVFEGNPPPTPPPPMPAPRRIHVGEFPGTALLYIGGAGLALIGALIGVGGLFMDTTVGSYSGYPEGRTHNIGLLNQQTGLVIAGSALFLGGVILLAVARIVGQLFRWGRPIVAYLDAASARP